MATGAIQGLAAAALDIMQHSLEGKAVVCFAHVILDIPYTVLTGMSPAHPQRSGVALLYERDAS
jgi:hypothetical protein